LTRTLYLMVKLALLAFIVPLMGIRQLVMVPSYPAGAPPPPDVGE
jgi:hypothetical protein